MRTTVGQLMVNEALPPELRNYSRHLTKKETQALFRELADKYPEKYREVAHKLMEVGADVSTATGETVALKDLSTARVKQKIIPKLRERIREISEDDSLTQKEKDDRIVKETAKLMGMLQDAVMKEGLEDNNALSMAAASGARGGPSQVNQLRGSPLLVTDNKNRVIPVPILNSFSEGLDPAEIWATSYGVRKGYIDVKSATPKAGYFGKQLANAAHKLVVTDAKPMSGTGLPVDTDDPDNEGSVLARDYGPIKEGTVLTPKMLKILQRKHKKILVHSPISSIAVGGGVPRYAAGVREKGGLPQVGENIGIAAAQATSEPLAQAAISSKHIAGVLGGGGKGATAEAQQGFDVVERMSNIPKTWFDKATVADVDGIVSKVEKAPQGGHYVWVAGTKHFVDKANDVTVKPGETLEAGDVLSSGMPNPAEVVKHKGVGEGRRYFMSTLRSTLKNSGININRRNVELLTRGLINHVRVKNEFGDYLPDDVVEYDDLAARYTPREGAKSYNLQTMKGKYLEQPVLHYSVGTRITPRVMKTLKEYDIKEVMAHDNEPDFEPEMQRAVDSLSRDPDWMVRLSGFQLQKNMLDAVHRGQTSSEHSLSYFPAAAKGVEFGKGQGPLY